MPLLRTAMISAVTFLILVSCSVQQDKPQLIETDVTLLMNDWVALWNSYNLSEVDNLFLNDSSLTYFSSEKEGIIRGIEAVREHHEGFGFIPGGKNQENKLWLDEITVDIFGGSAVVTAIWYFRRGPEGSDEIQRGPVTVVCTQTGTGVKISHMNFGNYE